MFCRSSSSTTMNNINWSIGLEVTLFGDRLHQHRDADHRRTDDLLGKSAQTAMVAGIWWWVLAPVVNGDHDPFHRPVPAFGLDERIHRSAQPTYAHGSLDHGCRAVSPEFARLLCDGLFRHQARGARRRHHAVCQKERDLWDCGQVVGKRRFSSKQSPPPFGRRSAFWAVPSSTAFSIATSTSSIRGASSRQDALEASLLHPSRLDERSQSRPPRFRKWFKDFALPHMGLARSDFFDVVTRHLERLHLSPSVLSAFPHELSGGMRQRVRHCACHRVPARIHHCR